MKSLLPLIFSLIICILKIIHWSQSANLSWIIFYSIIIGIDIIIAIILIYIKLIDNDINY